MNYSNIKNCISCRAHSQNAGNYYSWFTATTGGVSNNAAELNSICPRGWELTGAIKINKGSFYYLFVTSYGLDTSKGTSIRMLPLSYLKTGRYSASSYVNQANNGHYWTNHSYSSGYSYNLEFSSSFSPNHYSGDEKSYGMAVRCVSR